MTAIAAESNTQESGVATFVIEGSSSAARSGRDSHHAHMSDIVAQSFLKVRIALSNFFDI